MKKQSQKTAIKQISKKKHQAASKHAKVANVIQHPTPSLPDDLRNAILIVSLLLNLFAVCVWLTLNITSVYDAELFDLFVTR